MPETVLLVVLTERAKKDKTFVLGHKCAIPKNLQQKITIISIKIKTFPQQTKISISCLKYRIRLIWQPFLLVKPPDLKYCITNKCTIDVPRKFSLTVQCAGEVSPFLQNHCISLAILPTANVLASRDIIN